MIEHGRRIHSLKYCSELIFDRSLLHWNVCPYIQVWGYTEKERIWHLQCAESLSDWVLIRCRISSCVIISLPCREDICLNRIGVVRKLCMRFPYRLHVLWLVVCRLICCMILLIDCLDWWGGDHILNIHDMENLSKLACQSVKVYGVTRYIEKWQIFHCRLSIESLRTSSLIYLVSN